MEQYRRETRQIGAYQVTLCTPELESHEQALRRQAVEQGLYDLLCRREA